MPKLLPQIIKILQKEGLITSHNMVCTILEGGVSSEVLLVEEGDHRFVFKRALPQLQLDVHWPADVKRNLIEQDFFSYISEFMPESIPKVLYADRNNHFFCMEALDTNFQYWKESLLRGKTCLNTAQQAGKLLAKIHLHSLDCKQAEHKFTNRENFQTMRIRPYFEATAEKHPNLRSHFEEAIKRLERNRTCLIHGDFSPKNLMVNRDKLIIIDGETACYSDPAFDVAFLSMHLQLKSFLHQNHQKKFQKLQKAFLQSYTKSTTPKIKIDPNWLEKLIALLSLARIDGMSPVEYFDEQTKQKVRSKAYQQLKD